MGAHHTLDNALEHEDRQGAILEMLSAISPSQWLDFLVFDEDPAHVPGADFASATYYRYPPPSA